MASHARLGEIVARHLGEPWRQPLRGHSRRAFDAVHDRVESADQVILDSGCGVGHSTAHLAERYPDALVVGVDKLPFGQSAAAPPENALLV